MTFQALQATTATYQSSVSDPYFPTGTDEAEAKHWESLQKELNEGDLSDLSDDLSNAGYVPGPE